MCSELDYKFPNTLTRRRMVSLVASIFDSLGLAQLFVVAAKVLMREMIMNSKGKG